MSVLVKRNFPVCFYGSLSTTNKYSSVQAIFFISCVHMDFCLILKYQFSKRFAILGKTSFEHKKLYFFIAAIKYLGCGRPSCTHSYFDINGYPDIYHKSTLAPVILSRKTFRAFVIGSLNNANAFQVDEKIRQITKNNKGYNNLH
jgi:hypothetical protein